MGDASRRDARGSIYYYAAYTPHYLSVRSLCGRLSMQSIIQEIQLNKPDRITPLASACGILQGIEFADSTMFRRTQQSSLVIHRAIAAAEGS